MQTCAQAEILLTDIEVSLMVSKDLRGLPLCAYMDK